MGCLLIDIKLIADNDVLDSLLTATCVLKSTCVDPKTN